MFVRALLERSVPRDPVVAGAAVGEGGVGDQIVRGAHSAGSGGAGNTGHRSLRDDASVAVHELDLSDQFISTLADRELVAAFAARHRDVLPPHGAAGAQGAERVLAALKPPREKALDLARAERDARIACGGEVRVLDLRLHATAPRAHDTRTDSTWFEPVPGPRSSFIRLQLSRGDRFGPPGCGDNVDLVLSVLSALPHVEAIVTLAARHAHAWIESMRAGRLSREAPLTLLVVDEPPTPWAQDNGMPVVFAGGERGMLLSRGATRADLPLECVTVDDAAGDALGERLALRRAGWYFQGGDLLSLTSPTSLIHNRVLLVGEAQLARNLQLNNGGRAELDRLRAATGADRVVVLPSVSPHIDYEVCPVVAGSGILFMVGDQRAGAHLILRAAMERLTRANPRGQRACDPALARSLQSAVDAQDDAAVAQHAHAMLAPFMRDDGMLAHAFAEAFLPGADDAIARVSLRDARTHIGAARRTLAAIDTLSACAFADVSRATAKAGRGVGGMGRASRADAGGPLTTVAPFVAYLNALARLQAERERLHGVLRQLCDEMTRGMSVGPQHTGGLSSARASANRSLHGDASDGAAAARVASVPSLAFGERSACYVNALIVPAAASARSDEVEQSLAILVPSLESGTLRFEDALATNHARASTPPTLGIFAGVDREAMAAWQTQHPSLPVERAPPDRSDPSRTPSTSPHLRVVPVPTDESQRRQGGVHCAVQTVPC